MPRIYAAKVQPGGNLVPSWADDRAFWIEGAKRDAQARLAFYLENAAAQDRAEKPVLKEYYEALADTVRKFIEALEAVDG